MRGVGLAFPCHCVPATPDWLGFWGLRSSMAVLIYRRREGAPDINLQGNSHKGSLLRVVGPLKYISRQIWKVHRHRLYSKIRKLWISRGGGNRWKIRGVETLLLGVYVYTYLLSLVFEYVCIINRRDIYMLIVLKAVWDQNFTFTSFCENKQQWSWCHLYSSCCR